MTEKDTRWIQRFNNFNKAFAQLQEVVDASEQRELSKLEILGAIHIFEFTHELAWKTLKDFLENRGATNLFDSKDAIRAAFKVGLIENGEAWMKMIESRQLIAINYDPSAILKVTSIVINTYFAEFKKLQNILTTFKDDPEYAF